MFSENQTAKVSTPALASSSSPSPLTLLSTFSLFPNLAPELRLKIWSHACIDRTLRLQYTQSTDAFSTQSSPPTAFSVCHESRTEALRIYKLCFGTKRSMARIYFNPWRDTLYLPRCREMGYDETLRDFRDLVREEERPWLGETRSVAIDHVAVEVKRPWEPYNKASFVRSFKKLDEVVLVVDNDERVEEEGGVEFNHPKGDRNYLFRMWASFRQSVVMEEKLLEHVCMVVGKEYRPFTLPIVSIRSKALKLGTGREIV